MIRDLFIIILLPFIASACRLDLDQAYDTLSSRYYRTQLEICIAQQIRNCAIPENTVAPSSLSYAGNPFVFSTHTPITPINPTVDGNPTSYTVNPSLPTGVSINSETGQLFGRPLASKATTNYTVTASNPNGSTNFTLTLTVNFDPSSVPGLKFWVRAEGLGLTNGDPVNSWNDLSGTGNTVISGTAPVYNSITNTINGKPVIRFTYGGGHNLSKTSPVGVCSSDSGSVFFVARVSNVVNSNIFTIGPVGTGGREIQFLGSGVIAANKSGVSTASSYNTGIATTAIRHVAFLQNGTTNIVF